MNLYPHNQEAYERVMKAFEVSNRACVVHATGTGKSYIIAAVAQHFSSVLVVAPNNFVLNETRKVCHAGCEFRTYASVMFGDGDAHRYDLIVLDEFHRTGADKWGVGVQCLIEANPQAKLLGTSANNIRYLDNARNMADELFDGNVVSHLPLRKAIDLGILPEPTYVSSIYSMDDTVSVRKQSIKNCRSKIDKEGLCRKLDGIAHNWSNAGGVPRIISKYFTHDMQRIIVFCSKVSRAAKTREMLSEWFGLAGFCRVRYYNIDYQEKRLEHEMADFQAPLGDYDLKVAISVNMLNEGVHIPHVDGVILLRSTISRIIIEQQVGRCLTSNNVNIRPVVLDLVNNLDSIRYDDNFIITTNGEHSATTNTTTHDGCDDDGFPFKVIDECRDLRLLLDQLDSEIISYWTKEDILADARKYNTIKEWRANSNAAYVAAHRIGILAEATAHMDRLWSVKWNKETLSEDSSKYNSTSEWRKKSRSAYDTASRLGIIEEVAPHMNVTRYHKWTKEEVIADAKKYKTIKEWKEFEPKAYDAALRNKWINVATAHMTILKHNEWTIELCKQEALKYKSRNEWRKGKLISYLTAQTNGWLDECCAHMLPRYARRSAPNQTS